MSRRQRRLAVILIVAALVAPALLDRDSFPLATYPMYARSRGDVVSVATANGVDQAGEESRLSLQAIGDSDDPLIVEALVRDAIRLGEADTAALCRRIAARVVDHPEGFSRITVVTEAHNVVDRTSGVPSLVSRDVHETCDVVR